MELQFMKALFCLLLLATTLLQAEIISPFDGDPRGRVGGIVDAVSGELRLIEEDFCIDGPEKLSITRVYRNGWHYFPHTLLTTCSKDEHTLAHTWEPNGMPIGFQDGQVIELPAEYVNSQKSLGASTNCENMIFTDQMVVAADGTQRLYTKSKLSENKLLDLGPLSELPAAPSEEFQVYLLEREILPSGNQKLYTYDTEGRLSRVSLLNSLADREFGSLTISYSKDQLLISGSNRSYAVYTFDFDRLVRVQRSQHPDVEYRYSEGRLVQRNLPEGRALKISYNKAGRVASIKNGHSSEPLFKFHYLPRETTVWDARGCKTVYTSRNKKLVAKASFAADSEDSFFQRTRLYWGRGKEHRRLLAFTIADDLAHTAHTAVRYKYDESGNVVQELQFTGGDIEYDETVLPFQGAQKATIAYSFSKDAFHLLEKETDANGDMLQLAYKPTTNLLAQAVFTPCDGQIVRALYTYNQDAELIKRVVDKGGKGQLLEITRQIKPTPQYAALSTTTEKWFESNGAKEFLIRQEREYYDAAWNKVVSERYDRNGKLAARMLVTYDAHRNSTSSFNEMTGALSRFKYDNNDNLIRTTEVAKGSYTSFEYDAANQLVSKKKRFRELGEAEEQFSYDLLGNRVAWQDRYGNATQYRYDPLCNLAYTVSPPIAGIKNQRVIYTRDCRTDYKKRSVERLPIHSSLAAEFSTLSSPYKEANVSYDGLWRVVRRKEAVDENQAIYHCQNYDSENRIIERWIEQPDGSTVNHYFYTYGDYDNLLTTRSGDALLETKSYQNNRLVSLTDEAGRVTQIFYNDLVKNAFGQNVLQKTTIDPSGTVTIVTYDALLREAVREVQTPLGETLSKESFIYDYNNKIISHESAVLPDNLLKPDFVRQERAYNASGKLVARIDAVNTSYQKETRYQYGNDGRLSLVTYPSGLLKTFEYSADGKLAQVSKNGVPCAKVHYDTAGRVIWAVTEEGITTSRTYTKNGEIASETVSWEGCNNGYNFGPFSWTIGYEYDALGRVTDVRLPDGSTLQFLRNGIYQSAIVRRSTTNELLYSIPKDSEAVLSAHFSETVEERDVMGRPVVIVTNGERKQLSYDALGRIQRENSPRNIAYQYDSAGNMLKIGCRKFQYNILNQLERENSVKYSYDKDGGLRSIMASGKELRFSYDEEGHPRSYQDDDRSIEYLHDYFGRCFARVEKMTGFENCTYFFYIGTTEVGSYDKAGSLQDLKIPKTIEAGDAVDCVAIEIGKTAYFVATDLFRNVACLVKASTGELAERYSYTLFGEELIFTADGERINDSLVGNPWRFKGLRRGPVKGFLITKGRDLMPGLGHFTSPDVNGVYCALQDLK